MSDTTALNGDVDAIAESLIEAPQKDDEPQTEELMQSEEDDAQDQPEVDQEAEADDADEAEPAEETDEADESETDATEADTAEQLFTVKVDGRDQQVPLQELLRGYSGQAYIQKGMREVAELHNALQSERQQLAQFAQAMQTGDMPMRAPEPPSDDLLSSDPIGYLEARVKYDKDLVSYQQSMQMVQELTARNAEVKAAEFRAYLSEQAQKLAQAIPAFAKPETAAKVKDELLSVGRDVYGFDQGELQSVADHRMLRVLHDAAQYRRLMAGKTVEKQAAQAPKTPVIKPGVKAAPQASKRANADKAKAQMKRSGDINDVARFLLM